MSALQQTPAPTPTPAMSLPKQVQKQIDKANAVADEYYKSLKGDGAPPAGDPPAGDAPASQPAGDPPANNQSAAAPPPAATPLPQEGYEQKYKVLQGKYNAEVPRLQNTVREQGETLRSMREQLTATQTLLASFGSQRESAPAGNASSASAPAAPAKLVKDEEVREFGADLYDFIKRAAREEHASLLPEIERRVAPVAQRVDQVASAASNVARRVAQSDQQSVLTMLAQSVPNWTEINENPEFLAWLDQKDAYSGHVRGQMLEQAYKAHDGPRVVAFFNGFLHEHAAVTQPAPAASAPPAKPAPQRKLDDLVAPGTPKAGAAGTQDGSGKRVWTRAEIGKFYDDCTAGRFNSTDGKARRAAMEADIFAAQREGRVR